MKWLQEMMGEFPAMFAVTKPDAVLRFAETSFQHKLHFRDGRTILMGLILTKNTDNPLILLFFIGGRSQLSGRQGTGFQFITELMHRGKQPQQSPVNLTHACVRSNTRNWGNPMQTQGKHAITRQTSLSLMDIVKQKCVFSQVLITYCTWVHLLSICEGYVFAL